MTDAVGELGLEKGSLVFHGIRSMIEEGVAVSLPTAPFADGCIFDLKHDGGRAELIAEWRTHRPRASRVMHYVLTADRIEWIPSGPLYPRSDLDTAHQRDEVITLPSRTSDFVKVAVHVFLSRWSSGPAVEQAAELVAEDQRFNRWFLTHAKAKLGDDALLEVLEITEGAGDAVTDAWALCAASPANEVAWDQLAAAMTHAFTQLRAIPSRY